MSDRWSDERIDKVYGAGTIGAKWVRDLRDELQALRDRVDQLERELRMVRSGLWDTESAYYE